MLGPWVTYKALEVISTSDAPKNKQRQQLMQQV